MSNWLEPFGVAGFGDHVVADPTHLGAAPEGLDVQAFLVGVAVVYRDDPRSGLSVVVRVEVGHRLSFMVFIIGAANADSCSRLTVKCGGQRGVLRVPVEVVVLRKYCRRQSDDPWGIRSSSQKSGNQAPQNVQSRQLSRLVSDSFCASSCR